MPRKMGTPSLRRHKPSAQGVVTLNGKDHYLGKWPEESRDPPPEVRAAYDKAVSEWLASGRGAAAPAGEADPGPTVEDLLAAFWEHAERHYRDEGGSATSELSDYRLSLRPLRHLYAGLPASVFSPLKLKAVRELMVRGYEHPKHGPQRPLARPLVNQRVGRVVRCFRWGVAEEMIPAGVYQALRAVPGLQRGRCDARETEPVTPPAAGAVEATLPMLAPPAAALARLQALTGMRPGEACQVRLADIDHSGAVWLYRPGRHKTRWRGKDRVVALGPKAQAVILEFVRVRCPLCGVEGRPPRIGCRDGALCGPCADRTDDEGVCGPWRRFEVQQPDAYLFSPEAGRRERHEDMRAGRRTKVQPSQASRKKAAPKKAPGASYTARSYAKAVAKACAKAGAERWHPNQLRHAHATEVRRRFGLEAAQVALGHSQANVTQVYAERDLSLAARVAAEMG